MPYNDSLALLQARLQANLPRVATGGSSVVYNLLQAFVSAKTDTDYGIGQSANNMFLSTATGTALDTKANDYNAKRASGTQATASVTFSTPNPAVSLITIPAGLTLSTTGDAANPAIAFTTTSSTTIAMGATVAAGPVTVVAQLAGYAGNVDANTITVPITGVGSATLTVTNAAPATGGIDAGSDGQLIAAAKANISPKYGTAAILSAILAAGAFDAYVFDPQDGLGTITYYYADVTGAQPLGLTNSVVTAVANVLPANLLANPAAFTVINFASAQVHYSASPVVQTSTLAPIIQNAVAAYIQGLIHNQAPNPFSVIQSVNAAAGQLLSNFTLDTLNGLPPSSYSSGNTTLYRMTGNPLAVVTATRV